MANIFNYYWNVPSSKVPPNGGVGYIAYGTSFKKGEEMQTLEQLISIHGYGVWFVDRNDTKFRPLGQSEKRDRFIGEVGSGGSDSYDIYPYKENWKLFKPKVIKHRYAVLVNGQWLTSVHMTCDEAVEFRGFKYHAIIDTRIEVDQ